MWVGYSKIRINEKWRRWDEEQEVLKDKRRNRREKKRGKGKGKGIGGIR